MGCASACPACAAETESSSGLPMPMPSRESTSCLCGCSASSPSTGTSLARYMRLYVVELFLSMNGFRCLPIVSGNCRHHCYMHTRSKMPPGKTLLVAPSFAKRTHKI